VLEMMAKMNNTLNDLAAKFTNFQSTVTYWVNNTNAKISILE
jgi:flagellar hook assembly protein FlgD